MSTIFAAAESRRKAVIYIVCALALSCLSVSGIRLNAFPLFIIGFPGDFVLVLLTGVHGGGTFAENLMGGIVCVIVNTVFFYYLFRLIARLLKR